MRRALISGHEERRGETSHSSIPTSDQTPDAAHFLVLAPEQRTAAAREAEAKQREQATEHEEECKANNTRFSEKGKSETLNLQEEGGRAHFLKLPLSLLVLLVGPTSEQGRRRREKRHHSSIRATQHTYSSRSVRVYLCPCMCVSAALFFPHARGLLSSSFCSCAFLLVPLFLLVTCSVRE